MSCTCPNPPARDAVHSPVSRRSYGTECARNATGSFAGAYCIGNQCARDATGTNAGACCIGLECSSHNASCTGQHVPFTDHAIYTNTCRLSVDTDSTKWRQFVQSCSSNVSGAVYSTRHCTVPCSLDVHSFLRYVVLQNASAHYAASTPDHACSSSSSVGLGSSPSLDTTSSTSVDPWFVGCMVGIGTTLILTAAVVITCSVRADSGYQRIPPS